MEWAEWKPQLEYDSGAYGDEEAARLFELAKDVGGWIVEVGVYRGYTTFCMAAASQAQIACIDIWGTCLLPEAPNVYCPQPIGDIDCFRFFLERARYHNFMDRILPLRMTSEQAAAAWPADTSIALLHIDATHTYDDVMSDVRLWQPYLKPGAMACFHDYDGQYYPGVVRAVDELRAMETWGDFRVTQTMAELRFNPCE